MYKDILYRSRFKFFFRACNLTDLIFCADQNQDPTELLKVLRARCQSLGQALIPERVASKLLPLAKGNIKSLVVRLKLKSIPPRQRGMSCSSHTI